MDIVHSGYDVAGLLHPENPVLTRVCAVGPVRRAKQSFVRDCIALWNVAGRPSVQRVLDLGGGQGGDLPLLLRAEPSLRCIEVVDVDGGALDEYARRLRVSFRAEPMPSDGTRSVHGRYLLPGGCSVILHQANARELPPDVGMGADLVLMGFSASQILRGRIDVGPLFRSLRCERDIPRIAMVVHDHSFATVPEARDGVVIVPSPERTALGGPNPPPCLPRHRFGWCQCGAATEHGATRMVTTIAGTSMARGIEESAFDADALQRELRHLVGVGALPPDLSIDCQRPFAVEGMESPPHWLLESLTLIRIGNLEAEFHPGGLS